jgi:hypothetical protein
MADCNALRRVGLTFGAITALVAMVATTMVLRHAPATFEAASLTAAAE